MTIYVFLDVEKAYQSFLEFHLPPDSNPFFFLSRSIKEMKEWHSIVLHTSPHQAILIPNDRLILHRSLLARTSRKTFNYGIPLGRNKIRNGITRWRHQTVCRGRRTRRRRRNGRRRGRRADTVESGFQDVVTPSLH